jgi:predicted nuclease with TOPRIM domain
MADKVGRIPEPEDVIHALRRENAELKEGIQRIRAENNDQAFRVSELRERVDALGIESSGLFSRFNNLSERHERLRDAAREAEDVLGFHEGSAEIPREGMEPQVLINAEDHARILTALREGLAEEEG